MKKLLFFLCLLPIFGISQTTIVDSIVPNGTVIGNQTAIPIPVYAPGYPLGQALIYYPDDYSLPQNANKRYPLFVFLHGAGEGTKLNISEVTNTSLPYLIKNGLKPYGIDPITGDTVKYIIVSPHCAKCGGSYSFPQLKYTIPYLFTAFRVDTTCVWIGGLSSGGRGTWSTVMGDAGNPIWADTFYTKRITGIMPMANGGYDLALNNSINRGVLDTTDRRGLCCLYVIGDQDPGYNQIGFFAYQAEMKKYCQPGKYFDSVIIGGTHSANVWNTPFPLTARLWSKTMNSWTQMWVMRKTPPAIVTPPPPQTDSPVHAHLLQDSTVINYPNTAIYFFDSSYSGSGKLLNTQFLITASPTGLPPLIVRLSSGGIWVSRLIPGIYQAKLLAFDSATNYIDTSTIYFKVIGPPPPRKVISLIVSLYGVQVPWPLDAAKIGYDDGNP